MRYNNPQGWADATPSQSWLRPPNVIIRKEEFDLGTAKNDADLYAAGPYRDMWYIDESGNRFFLRMVFYIHPTGAAAITLGALTYNSSNVATYTPAVEGEFISELGVLGAATDTNDMLAGMLQADYYWQQSDNLADLEEYRLTTLNAGDGCWLIREGICYPYSTGAVTADRFVVPTAAGQVVESAVINTGGTIAQYEASILNNRPGLDNGFALGRALETTVGAGFVKTKLEMSKRMHR